MTRSGSSTTADFSSDECSIKIEAPVNPILSRSLPSIPNFAYLLRSRFYNTIKKQISYNKERGEEMNLQSA